MAAMDQVGDNRTKRHSNNKQDESSVRLVCLLMSTRRERSVTIHVSPDNSLVMAQRNLRNAIRKQS